MIPTCVLHVQGTAVGARRAILIQQQNSPRIYSHITSVEISSRIYLYYRQNPVRKNFNLMVYHMPWHPGLGSSD